METISGSMEIEYDPSFVEFFKTLPVKIYPRDYVCEVVIGDSKERFVSEALLLETQAKLAELEAIVPHCRHCDWDHPNHVDVHTTRCCQENPC